MPTAEEYRGSMRAVRLETAEALRSIPGLVSSWTSKPQAREGQEGWSPREVALHMVYGEWYMLDGTVQMLSGLKALPTTEFEQKTGEAALAWARLKRDQQGVLELGGPEEAAAALLAVGDRLDPLLRLFTDEHLALVVERPSGPVTIERRLKASLDHALDHVNQLRSFAPES